MLDQKDKYWIWQGQKFDIEGKYWSYIGQGHSLVIGLTNCGQSLDIGQSVDKLWGTDIDQEHPCFLKCPALQGQHLATITLTVQF